MAKGSRSMGMINHLFKAFGGPVAAPRWPPRRLSLALQGGGSFGAFTWGVIDRLLDEPELNFDAISGASAGAINATLLASGMLEGGRAGAQARLKRFWKRMSAAAAFLPSVSLATSALKAGMGPFSLALSPYQFNPFNLNPLREALEAEVDFERLRAHSPMKLLVGATRVKDGSLKIFTETELTIERVLASACLPLLHQTIEVDGEPYWDGGYVANPPLIPLVQASKAANLLIVQVTPNQSDKAPSSPREIAKRLDQINFNSTLSAELEALKIALILGLTPKLKQLRIGRISAEDEIAGLGSESAGDLNWAFLERLHHSGRAAVDLWFEEAQPPALSR